MFFSHRGTEAQSYLIVMDYKVNRFLDFNPPDGGTAGQVIEVDLG
jgi:hypothetical protein